MQSPGFPGDSIKIRELEKCEKMKSINYHCRGVTKTLTITKNSKLRNRLLDFRGISGFLISDFFWEKSINPGRTYYLKKVCIPLLKKEVVKHVLLEINSNEKLVFLEATEY